MKDFKYQISVDVNGEDYYYNSHHDLLVTNPMDAGRYKTNDCKSILDDKKLAERQGNKSKIVLFDDAFKKYKESNYD